MGDGSVGRSLVALVAVMSGTGSAGCASRAATRDAQADSRPESHSCGGTIAAGGTTPVGAFVASDVYLSVVFYCRQVEVYLTDWQSGRLLGFSFVPSATDATDFTGPQTGTATLVPIAGWTSSVMTTFEANVSAANDPFAAGTPDAGPIGQMDASFSLTHDGFSVAGLFSSPYCRARECQF